MDNSCAVNFEKGETYLVYASVDKDTGEHLRTNTCSGTGPLSEVSSDIDALGEPDAEGLATPKTGGSSIPLMLSVIGAGVVLSLVGVGIGWIGRD